MPRTFTRLAGGFSFLEGPRWHDGRLWVSDMHDGRVLAVDRAGNVETVVEVPGRPSGLGWLPDGRLLIVSMTDRRLLRLDGSALAVVAELGEIATFHCNDMVVDGKGRAWIGNFGWDFEAGGAPQPATLALVTPDGAVSRAAGDLVFPNGSVVTPDGETLIVAETFGARLTAFTIQPDGSLAHRRVWAQLEVSPDGICLDAEGAIWVASPLTNEVVRVREGGEVAERIPTDGRAIACTLGGDARRTLFAMVSSSFERETCLERRDACIVTTEVEVPGAGWP